MRKTLLIVLTAILILTSAAWGGTRTTQHNLYKPDYGESGSTWWSEINANFDIIDAMISVSSSSWIDDSAYNTIELADGAAVAAGKLLAISQAHTLTANTVLNAKVIVLPGGSFTKASTFTLTFSGSFQNPSNSQSFIGFAAGDVTFGLGSTTKEGFPQWWGAKADGATDDLVALDSAFKSGIPINLIRGTSYYKVSATIPITTANCEIYGSGTIRLLTATIQTPVINITANNVKIKDITIWGRHTSNDYVWGEHGIRVYGQEATRYSGIEITGVTIHDCGGGAIRLYFTDRYKVNSNYIYDCYYGGVEDIAGHDGQINFNQIEDIYAQISSGDAYGIAVSTSTTGTYVKAQNIQIIGNTIKRVPWEGIDTHGGVNLTILANKIYDCAGGIAVTVSDNMYGVPFFAEHNVVIRDNIIDAVNLSSSYGISLEGVLGKEYADGLIISGNVISNVGDQANQWKSGIYSILTRGTIITGNYFLNCTVSGINMYTYNYGFIIEDNIFIDMYSTAGANQAVIIGYINNEGYIGNNSLVRGDNPAGSVNYYFLSIYNSATNRISYSNKAVFVPSYRNLDDPGDRTIRGTTAVTSGTGEDVIGTATFWPGSTHTEDTIKITFYGLNTGSAGNKTIKFKYGDGSSTLMAADNNTYKWWGEVRIKQTSATTASVFYIFHTSAPSTTIYGWGVNAAISADITMQITGECSDSGDTIGMYLLNIER